ncbi:MAG: hypothetical protein ACRC9V_01180 [Aeromonas sp.]
MSNISDEDNQALPCHVIRRHFLTKKTIFSPFSRALPNRQPSSRLSRRGRIDAPTDGAGDKSLNQAER